MEVVNWKGIGKIGDFQPIGYIIGQILSPVKLAWSLPVKHLSL